MTLINHQSLSAAQEEIKILHNQLDGLRELVLDLSMKLQRKREELKNANHRLEKAVTSTVGFEEALTLAKAILRHGRSPKESLADLLSAVYTCAVVPKDLE